MLHYKIIQGLEWQLKTQHLIPLELEKTINNQRCVLTTIYLIDHALQKKYHVHL
jgi:hypothetical protein